jgi:hypothetical protein
VWKLVVDLPNLRDVGPNGRSDCEDPRGSREGFGGVMDKGQQGAERAQVGGGGRHGRGQNIWQSGYQ